MRYKLLIPLLWLVASVAAANGVQPSADILAAARATLTNAIGDMSDTEVSIGRLDPRLRLARCDVPLGGFLPPGGNTGGNISVGVRCEGSRPWTLYVSATVSHHAEVAVLTRPMARGETVDASTWEFRRQRVDRIGGAWFSRDNPPPSGLMAARPLPAGTVLATSVLTRPVIIERGQVVRFIGDFGSIQVETSVKAMEQAVAGELFRVKHLKTGRIMDAVAVSEGVARLPAQQATIRSSNLRGGSQAAGLSLAKDGRASAATMP